MPVVIGTSGWHYSHWRSRFYPAHLGERAWLPFYSERFAAVELNNVFYRLPEKAIFERWRDSVPTDFVFAVKASRYLTHVRRLENPDEPVRQLVDRVRGLGTHLGPVLLQLPPTLKADPERLETALAAFLIDVRLVVEPRHASWFIGEVRGVLERRSAALCLADGGPVQMPTWRTADWGYVRFHHGTGRPESCYKQRELDAWADLVCDRWDASTDVYCFFNNDANGCALRDARRFANSCADRGRDTTRVPKAGETRV